LFYKAMHIQESSIKMSAGMFQSILTFDTKKAAIQGTKLGRLGHVGVLYEDNHILVLSKPACVPTVPDSSEDVSLLDWGKMYLKKTRGKPGKVFLGVVHRLDRPVSGVVCFAVTSKAASRLSDQFRAHKISKTYLALTEKKPPSEQGVLEHMLKKNMGENIVRVISPGSTEAGGKFAQTSWTLLEAKEGIYLLELKPGTGRPHQLRVQCAFMGCPLLGDVKYGAEVPLPDASIGLHAHKLEFLHPIQRKGLSFSTPPPGSGPWRPFTGSEVQG
jgi:23S rRNA pseudouridine1911/1915/1917 synthase